MIDTLYPPITIVMTTYFPPGELGVLRRVAASRTQASWKSHLCYRGALLLHIADDGSETSLQSDWIRISRSVQSLQGVGASLNQGFRKAFETSPLVLFAADDWGLKRDFDLTPWARLLMEREDVGLVNLGPPYPNVRGRVEILTEDYQGWGLRLDKINLVCGLRPSLYHKRFIDSYGWFIENTNALECERLHNEHFCATLGPDAVLALPHPWEHFGLETTSRIEPCGK